MTLNEEQVKKLEELGFEGDGTPWYNPSCYKKTYGFDIYIHVLSTGTIFHNGIYGNAKAQADLSALKGVGL